MAKKPPTRNQLRKRAGRQARQSTAAERTALNRAERSARRTYRTELGASRGAKKATLSLLDEAASSIPGNIHGLALQQIQSELAGRADDAQGMVKYEKAGLRQDLRSALSDIEADRAALAAATAEEKASILQESIKRQREKRQEAIEKRTKYDREIQKALAEIRQSVAKTRGPGATALKIERATLRSDASLRRNLIDYLTTSQDISRPAAKKAVSTFTRGKNDAADRAGLAAVAASDALAHAAEYLPDDEDE
ncbi:MAG: hypothetical protein HUU17_06140 [Chthonomonadales bacterium]|nr:hypothetical protein [Chthonomonadales bacterium]